MEKILNEVESSSAQVHDMVRSIVNNNTNELDVYIDSIRELFLSDKPIPDGDLDKIILKIPTYIYYLTQVQQQIDIRKGVSAESAKYTENQCLLGATGTVVEKQAKAANDTINNRVVQLAYKTASALIQSKVNGAMEILASAKRVQQRRLEEMRLTKTAGDSVAF